MDLHTIELFAGVGMLGEGLRAGLGYLGIQTRTVCYVEREAYAAAVLAARIQEGSLGAAPIWSDVATFNARRWAGVVDCVVAGFPCQDLSLAGQRAGLDGARSGLFFEVLRIARDCGAEWLFLENVAGIATATATAVDEAEGALEERAAARVVGELADLGWDSEWITISASDVGASHGRSRWFCLAWRNVADTERAEWWKMRAAGVGDQQRHDRKRPETHGGAGEPDAALGHAHRQRAHRSESLGQQAGHHEPAQSGGHMGHPGLQHQHLQQREDGAEHSGMGSELAHPQRGSDERRGNPGELARTGGHTEGEARQRERGGPAADGGGCAVAIFAPGPTDPTWPGIIQRWPHLAPALEPDFRGMADGVAHRMDDSRAQRLKCCGNGVVAAQAAAAFVELYRRLTWHSSGR